VPTAARRSPSSAPATDEPGRGRPIEADDLFRVRLVSDPQPSPDGSRVAYVVTRLDKPVPLLDSGTRAVQSIRKRCLVPRATPPGSA
jgi:dipeptidyl aminopeptidase/acylaminoacyl peptidase